MLGYTDANEAEATTKMHGNANDARGIQPIMRRRQEGKKYDAAKPSDSRPENTTVSPAAQRRGNVRLV